MSQDSSDAPPTAATEAPGPAGPSAVEGVKADSRHLRGNVAAELVDPSSGTVSQDSYNILKFHGIYAQDDRDERRDRARRKVELAHIFMVRSSLPGGTVSAQQWLAMDKIADDLADGTMRITTRQDIQFHGVVKSGLRPLVATLNEQLVSTLAACGDVVRNVICCPAPDADGRQAKLLPITQQISARFKPQTRAYAEIWFDGEKAASILEPPSGEVETVYGDTYLPRKFKIALAWPGDNCVDVLSNDIGVVPAEHPTSGQGYMLFVGGGMGMNHAFDQTYPRLATPLGWVDHERLGDACQAIIAAFRDHGNRSDRRIARLKYLIEDRGTPWFRDVVEQNLGSRLGDPVEVAPWISNDDHLGWNRQDDGNWYLGVQVPNGRLRDSEPGRGYRSALREIVQRWSPEIRLTCNQDALITGIAAADRAAVDAVLAANGITPALAMTPTRRRALACPALPTCGQALGESERVMPEVLDIIEGELAARGLSDDGLLVRMTGCPNGCARPYNAELGIVGRTKTAYDIYVGGSATSTRMAGLVQKSVKLAQLPEVIGPLLDRWGAERHLGESFGDFTHRIGADQGGVRQ